MKIFAELRLLATLRRIAKALEEANRIERAKLTGEVAHRLGEKRRAPKVADFSVATPEDWNKRWREQHPEAEEEAG